MLIFVHIPKTAGSSVNKTLESVFESGVSHVEASIENPDFQKQVATCDWISGHVTRVAFDKALNLGEPPVYLAFLRSPTEQLIFHIKWQFAIFDKGKEFFLSHPLRNQIISLEAMSVNYRDTSSIIAFIEKHRGMFLNFQCNYILSDMSVRLTKDIVRSDASHFQLLGTTERIYATLPKLFLEIAGSGSGALALKEERENTNSNRYFDEEVFRGLKLSEYLTEHNARDKMLYDMVKNEIEPRFLERH